MDDKSLLGLCSKNLICDCGFGSVISESEVFCFINNKQNKEFGLHGVMWLLILSAIPEWFGNTKPKRTILKPVLTAPSIFVRKLLFHARQSSWKDYQFFISISYFPRVSLALH